jgi:hypothetical protein
VASASCDEVLGQRADGIVAIPPEAGRPGVHPHWLHVFAVPELDRAIATVRARGGLALEPVTLPAARASPHATTRRVPRSGCRRPSTRDLRFVPG